MQVYSGLILSLILPLHHLLLLPSPSKLSQSESPGSKSNCNLTPNQTKPPNQEKEAYPAHKLKQLDRESISSI